MATNRRGDLDVIRDVTETLTWDTRIEDNRIKVAAQNGRVTLRGTVPQFSQKTAASEDAWRIKGVREVVNELMVSPPNMRTDRAIADDVFAALRSDARVHDPSIVVDVAGSVVRLSGVVPTLAQKRAAEEDAWNILGVVDVANDLTVTPHETRSDRDIEDDVKIALTRDARLDDPLRINVSVVQGKAFLRGAVDTIAARQAAEEDARFTAGVTDVDNELALVPD